MSASGWLLFVLEMMGSSNTMNGLCVCGLDWIGLDRRTGKGGIYSTDLMKHTKLLLGLGDPISVAIWLV